jgi:hypothetical protein
VTLCLCGQSIAFGFLCDLCVPTSATSALNLSAFSSLAFIKAFISLYLRSSVVPSDHPIRARVLIFHFPFSIFAFASLSLFPSPPPPDASLLHCISITKIRAHIRFSVRWTWPGWLHVSLHASPVTSDN